MTDEQLLVDFQSQSDDSAFEGLVLRHGPMVFRVCRDILGDRGDAEDAFQATFLVLVRRATSIRERSSIGRWLYEVACRISRRERRRIAKVRNRERQAPSMVAEAPCHDEPADRESKPVLHEEIRRLPSKLRDPILLCYFEGLTVEDAARRLACPVGTLKSRLVKGRELLRCRLTRRGVAASVLLPLMFSLTEEASAVVPGPLLRVTLKAGLAGAEGARVSRRVASMVIEEEARKRWGRMASSWALLLFLLLAIGTSRVVLGRHAIAGPPTPASASPTPPAWPRAGADVRATSGIVPDHCRGR